MDSNLVKYMAFIRTVECGSFTKAAEQLNYSQSGISRMINDLETEWHVKLLERSRAGVRLTSDGLTLLPYAKSVCEDYRRLQMQIDDLKGLQTGIIRIGTIASVAEHWLPRIISRFRQDYPNIDYELLIGDYGEIEQWISDGRVDCGFICSPIQPGLDSTVLERDELMAVLPKGHPLAERSAVPIEELCRGPFMLLERGARGEVSELFERRGLVPDIQFKTLDDYAVMSMVECGLGLAILPALILKRIPYNVEIRSLAEPAFRDICFVMRNHETAPLAVKRFVDYLGYRNSHNSQIN